MDDNDLISRAVLQGRISSLEMPWDYVDAINSIASISTFINEAPAVDAVPVVHGRWIEKRWTTEYDCGVHNHRVIVCSACSNEIENGEQTFYCPNCGAKMDAERREDDGTDA